MSTSSKAEVAQRGHPVAVRGFVLDAQQERALGVAFFLEPFDGHVGDDVGAVAFDGDLAVGVMKSGL
jgi:hypothetical protein